MDGRGPYVLSPTVATRRDARKKAVEWPYKEDVQCL